MSVFWASGIAPPSHVARRDPTQNFAGAKPDRAKPRLSLTPEQTGLLMARGRQRGLGDHPAELWTGPALFVDRHLMAFFAMDVPWQRALPQMPRDVT